ncbi:MAG: Gx transporter family protein [Ruminococcaceae bacterium]|nr:Gx transporter family protein [Oscillospiraceae bacterium]
MNRAKSIAFTGLCVALALILAYVELLLPPLSAAIPGIKMGLPNVIIVFLLYRRSARSAALVSLLRILLVGMLFGNAMSLMYSLAGGVLSLAVMILLRRLDRLSAVGVSVAGAVAHNVGQILAAMVLLDTSELAYYLVVLVITGTVAGVLIGLCGALLIRRIPESLLKS